MIINFLNATRFIVNTETGFKLYAQFWANENFLVLFDLLNACINLKRPPVLFCASMAFLRSLLLMQQSTDHNFATFSEFLDNISMSRDESNFEEIVLLDSDDENQDPNANSKRDVKKKKHRRGNKYQFGSELLTAKLIRIYNELCKKDKIESGIVTVLPERRSCYKVMQVLLMCSERARTVARDMEWTSRILQRLEEIYSGLGMTCKDFIRRYGDDKVKFCIFATEIIISFNDRYRYQVMWLKINDC